MKSIRNLFVLSLLLLSVSVFAAADPAPVVMLKNTTNKMLAALDKHIGQLKGNSKLVDSLVNKILVPHFDLTSMSQAVVGQYWNKASSATQEQFKKEFTHYVARTYSSAIQSYDGETMKFYPIRGAVGDKVQISSELLLKNGPSIQLKYSVEKKGNEWLIYDFSVAGISIVKNYNSQFTGTLRQKGLDGLVSELKKNNVAR